jgi:hypothetical protein
MECLGCCRVTRKYFCSGLDSVGKMDCAASNDSIGVFSFTESKKSRLEVNPNSGGKF